MSTALNKRVNCRNYDANFASRLKVPLLTFGSSFTGITSNNIANNYSERNLGKKILLLKLLQNKKQNQLMNCQKI